MSKMLTAEQLETRMRPGQYSQGGFLGLNESLEEVIGKDEQILAKLGVTHEKIASVLEKVLASVREQEEALPFDEQYERRTDFPDLYHPEKNPVFSKENLPELSSGYIVDFFQIFILQYRGFQVCPWDDCDNEGSFDFMILNRNTGEYFMAPALIVHLIRAHRFFEGVESPYRVDPEKVVRILELS